MKFSKFLEDYIEEDAQLETSKLCLFQSERIIGFYKYNTDMHDALSSYDMEKAEDNIIGGAEWRENASEACLEVETIHAEKGYGPLIYLTLMELSNGKGVCPNRIRGKVSLEAAAVWQKFLNPPEGTKTLAKSLGELKNRVHENPALNHKYINIYKPNLKLAIQNNQKVIGKDPYGEKKTTLIEAIDSYIRSEMNNIYGN